MTPEQHLRAFAEFYAAVQLAGGTTPHVSMTVAAARRSPGPGEQLWWAGCYAAVYNFATAEVLWRRWRPGQFTEKELAVWLTQHWGGIALRKERKAVRSPAKLARCLASYGRYIAVVQQRDWFRDNGLPPRQRYETGFVDLCDSVDFMGRYIAIRWLEVVRRLFDDAIAMPDLRPHDGYHPRKALALMYPGEAAELLGDDSAHNIAVTNGTVERCRDSIAERWGIAMSYYEMQSLLCEYKQSALGKKQYPGKSVDTELKYWDAMRGYWGADHESIMHEVRSAIFPDFSLGERAGWPGVRPELGAVLVDFGYTWSDALYDYPASMFLAQPVRRPGAPALLEEAT